MPVPGTNQVTFPSASGLRLAAKLEWPPEAIGLRAVAIFAHCFTCTKDLPCITRISRALAAEGIAVLRLDFTGLGQSEGDFSHSNFSSNVADLIAAADYLSRTIGPPTLLIGHSLGGAASIAAAVRLEGIRGIVAIAAPSQPAHLADLLAGQMGNFEPDGTSRIVIGGQTFALRRQLLDDLRAQDVLGTLRDQFRGAFLVLHSPEDATVDIQHAEALFAAASQPKSFVALPGADHLLAKPTDSAYAASVIAAWAGHVMFD
ncbi:MAG: alpha/beta fold hydrolase [Verrucomicrobiae bacterium]|nr:alpha/beta fold hydrolase [Verrucomicrobiae bacterium]